MDNTKRSGCCGAITKFSLALRCLSHSRDIVAFVDEQRDNIWLFRRAELPALSQEDCLPCNDSSATAESPTSMPSRPVSNLDDSKVDKGCRATINGDDRNASPMISVAGDSKDADNSAPYQVVMRRDTARAIKKHEKRLNEIRQATLKNAKGIFKATFSVVNEKGELIQFPPGTVLNSINIIQESFPNATISSRGGTLEAWVNSMEELDALKKIQTLSSLPVFVKCGSADRFVGRISGVDKGFTEEEILSALKPVGVTLVKRVARKLRTGTEVRVVHTDTVFLHFNGLPPESIYLASRKHQVILDAGRPPVCFNCQRIGHISSGCTRPKACMNCGGVNHLAAQCQRRPKCVNCHQSHPAWHATCPVRSLAMEGRKALLEARLRAQVGHTHQDAVITENVRANTPDSCEKPVCLGPISYADAVAGRTIVIRKSDDTTLQVNLPKMRAPPRMGVDRSSKKQSDGTKKRQLPSKKQSASIKKTRVSSRRRGKPLTVNTGNCRAGRSTSGLPAKLEKVKSSKPVFDHLKVSTIEDFLSSLNHLMPLLNLVSPSFAEACRKIIADAPAVLEALLTLKPLFKP